MPELYWTIAAAWARLGDGSRALEALQNAVRTGWRDASWMECDSEFSILRDTSEFRFLVEGVRAWQGALFDEENASTGLR
jgi:hypothetical protein